MAHGCFLLGRSHIRQELMTSFHEVLFPLDIALKSAGGPQRRTDVVTLGSGAEERNARWAHSRRRYDAGYGVKTFEALSQVVAFFEERRGRLYGFRWRDRLDHSSAAPGVTVAPTDQIVGTGDGVTATFQLGKTYGALYSPYRRPIAKPVPGSIRVAVAETAPDPGTQFTVDAATGVVTFRPGHNLLGITLGSTNNGVIGPTAFYANTKVRVTANGGNFTAGKVRLIVYFLEMS